MLISGYVCLRRLLMAFVMFFALVLLLFCIAPSSLVAGVALAQSDAPQPSIRCDDITATETQINFSVRVDLGERSTNAIQMGMIYDEDVLSAPVVRLGRDFNMQFHVNVETGDLATAFTRSGDIGHATGDVEYATVTFDWSGAATTVEFLPADLTGRTGTYAVELIESEDSEFAFEDIVLETNNCSIASLDNMEITPKSPTIPITMIPMSPVPSPSIRCDHVTATDTQISFSVKVDLGDRATNTIQMEMIYDEDVLSEPLVETGREFNVQVYSSAENSNLWTIFNRIEDRGSITGDIDYATVTFDWSGAATTVLFVSADEGSMSGTLAIDADTHEPFSLRSNPCSLIALDGTTATSLNNEEIIQTYRRQGESALLAPFMQAPTAVNMSSSHALVSGTASVIVSLVAMFITTLTALFFQSRKFNA